MAELPISTATGGIASRSRENFIKFASFEENGEKYMNKNDFVRAIAPDGEDYHKIQREQYAILFDVADRGNKSKIDLNDWVVFENLLARPDAEYVIAFRLFDVQAKGEVSYADFQRLWTINTRPDSIPFDFNAGWASLYTGDKRNRHPMSYPQFSQMLRGLQGERVRQAFKYFDKSQTGYIESHEFQRIILETARHKLSDHLLENLHTLCNISAGSKVSYSNVRAFQNVVREMDMVSYIVLQACQKTADGKITKSDFLNEAARSTKFSLFTPMEVDVLFHFASLDNQSGRLGTEDFARVLEPSFQAPDAPRPSKDGLHIPEPGAHTKDVLKEVFEQAYHFGLGAIAGGIGATLVYPIDLVKTRMQNQRSNVVGEVLYRNSLDCAKKVFRNEGAIGFYSGLGPQLVGVAPEKAIKLTVNDFMRARLKSTDGTISYPLELLSGGTAGACQVIFTNPLEIVKIRLQVQGEVAKENAAVPRRTAFWIVRNLGLFGLYRGASACLLRDIPFSAIYFPAYAHLKKDVFHETATHKLGIGQLLLAGAAAGMPAAYLTTPADVIKTRLQVEARKGQKSYRNIKDAAITIFKDEGFKAFFKGGPARILRSSPQFGATLASYELLQRLLPMPGSHEASLALGVEDKGNTPLPYLRSRNALKIILDLDANWGRYNDKGKLVESQ